MKYLTKTAILAVAAFVGATVVHAQNWAPGISVDGNVDDWEGQIPAAVVDVSGDGGSGRDVKAIYLANDASNLYVRIESYNSDAYDGNEFTGIDGDNSTATGFNLFGLGIGSDTLIAGASAFGETTTNFNNGAANPGSINFYPWWAATDVELAIPLSMTIPGDIAQSFPGGLGSTIAVVFGDGNGGAGDTIGPVTYQLATNPGPSAPTNVIDDFDDIDDVYKAAKRTHIGTVSAGCSINSRNSVAGASGNAGDYALAVQHQNANVAWVTSQIGRRFAVPKNLSGAVNVTLDVYGDPAATQEQIWLGLIDADGTYYATTDQAVPTSAGWTTVNFGDPSTWYLQAAGNTPGLDLSNIVEYRIGVSENGNGQGGTFNLRYDNLKIQKAGVNDWALY